METIVGGIAAKSGIATVQASCYNPDAPAAAGPSREANVMDIHHIRYFLAFCETMNFTRAAERCHVAQPALSRAIQQLEHEIGGSLIRRDKQGNSLTELGLLMRPRLQTVVDELGQAKRQAKRFLSLEKANLRLGILCTVGPTRFTALLMHFAQQFPGITVQVFEGSPEVLQQKLKSGDIDLALMASSDPYPDDVEAEILYRERFVVAFAPGHRFANMNAVPVAAVDGENYLRRLNCEFYEMLAHAVVSKGAALEETFMSEREDWIQNMAAGGFGICFIPEFSALIPGVMTRPLMDPEVWRDMCVVTCKGKQPNDVAQKFRATLRAYPFPESSYR
jgi:DNA-binding transcriptional LysR family regulator